MTTPGQSIALASLLNLRDIGGYPTADGRRVRTGVVFRSTDLSRLDDSDASVVEALGLRTVVDLRTTPEREAAPDRRLEGVDEIVLDVLADAGGDGPEQLLTLMAHPAQAADILGDGKAVALLSQAYRQIVSLPSGLDSYRRLFGMLADGDDLPLLFHCTTGKDRTGWAAAATLLLLGVSKDDVSYDYLLTNEQLVPHLQPLFDQFTAAGGDASLLSPVLGARPEYLAAALDEVETRFGSIEGYIRDGLGVDADQQQRIRDALTE